MACARPRPCGAVDRELRGSCRRGHASDVLVPMLHLNRTADPAGDYLAALRLLESVAGGADVVIPGHGSVGGAGQVRARLAIAPRTAAGLAPGRRDGREFRIFADQAVRQETGGQLAPRKAA